MKSIAALCMLALAACGLGESTYTLDGVPVTLENLRFPKKDHLSLAVQLFRNEAREHWALDEDAELVTWRSIREIRWTQEGVVDHADYDESIRTVYANWLGCALLVPLYSALNAHYAWMITELEPSLVEYEWAEDLQEDMAPTVCTGGRESVWDRIGL